MTPEFMNAVLLDARPDELPGLLESLSMFESIGMPEHEADEWRRRILALIPFHETGDSMHVA